MANVISVASGKGGVGKSIVAANLAILLARRGWRVVLADLDTGSANLHVMLGRCSPPASIADFLTRRTTRLADLLQPVDFCPGLQFLAGTSDTLETANPHHASAKRLLRELGRLDADVVVIDVGARATCSTLDAFLAADHPIAVTTPDPTAILDVYAFIKLAAVRLVQSHLGSRDADGVALKREAFATLAQVAERAGTTRPERTAEVEDVLARFRPLLLMNRLSTTGRVNVAHVKRVLRQYVGADLEMLGEIPEDPAVARSVRTYLPVVESDPESPATIALMQAADRLAHLLARQTVDPYAVDTGERELLAGAEAALPSPARSPRTADLPRVGERGIGGVPIGTVAGGADRMGPTL